MNTDSRVTQAPGHCQQCGRLLRNRKRFCSQACWEAYRLEHADRSEQARARRRLRLGQAYVDGEITEAEYRARLQGYREHDLI